MGGGKEEQARTAITDQGGVSTDSTDKLFVTDSSVEVGDLLCEGVVEGLVSGKYTYAGTKGETGFYSTGFAPYTASGTTLTQDPELGFLRSVYWNDVPVVDINGYYNFTNINLEYVKGEPVGNLPALSSKLPANETVDLTVHRVIGERLYGLSIQGGTAPTVSKSPAWDPANPSMRWSTGLPNTTRIDAVAKTYTILNKECTAIEVKIKVPALWEQIRSDKAPKKHEVDKTPPPVGYGDTKARSIQYWIYWQPVFDERFDGVKSEADSEKIEKIKGTWEGPLAERVTGKLTEPYVRTTKIDLTSAYTSQYGFDGWRIKIIRVTPESLTSYFKMVTYVDSLTEIYGTKLRYPYSSMIYSKFNAEFFTRIPARSYDAKLLKVLIPNNYHPIKKTYGCSDALTMASATEVNCKVEIEAGMKVYFENGAVFSANLTIGAGATNVTLTDKGSIADSLPDYVAADPATGATVEGNNNTSPATTSTNFWDGGFRYTREWTDNPAWCFYDLLTSSRYGLGDHIDKLQVDKWALYEIAQYCDVLVPDGYGSIEPRFTINHIITSREEAYKVLNDMASIFRGLAYYSNGLIYAVQDAYKKPVYQFNNANVTDGNFTYSSSAKKTRHSVALVRYIDRRNLFQPSVEYVENEEAIKRYGIRQLETTALGCTSRGQARRFGLWMLASESQETESLAFSVGQDGGYLKPGDILQVYDQYRTPLKFGGRTNAVLNTSVAPSTLTYENLPVTGNSIIIDNAINFNDKYYKFSLLTPTYYYDTADIGDNLDSSGINQIRRSQIQDLYFYGPHALTVTGYYRSDYNVGGSGVATQIYFHTGLLIEGGPPIGTGNQLDFENYVITGYTNDYVQEGTETNPVTSEISYSGGCFSGENLIWSIEPNDPTDDEFISGNFSTYRVINVSENDDTSSYNVSALAYSSGKYDDVEGRLTFQSPNVVKPPVWPYLATLGTAGYSALVTVRKAHPNEKVEKEGEPVTFVETARLEKYPTIEIRFPQAGFNYIRDKSTGELAPTAIVGGGTSYLIDPNSANPKAIRYLICVKRDSVTTGDGFEGQTFATVFTGGVSMKYISVPSNTNNFKDYYAPHQFKYLDGDTIETNPYLIEQPDASNPLLHEFLFEFLADEDTSFWVAIFAVNNDIVSENAFIGLIPGSKADTTGLGSMLSETKNNKLSSTDVFSNIAFVTISSLSSEDKEPSTNEEIVELQTTEPSFSWIKGDTRVIYDDLGNRLFIPDPYDDYRITVRKNTDTAASFDPIFIELTGYHSPSDTPNFVLLRDYNDPNMIESLVSNPDASGYTHEGAWIEDKSDPLCEWFKVETSGVIFRNSPENFPLRDFELVVEAHDSAGTTSAGNKVWDNTLRKDSVNHYAEDGNEGWDIFAGTLAVPSGIVFATASLTNAQKKEGTIHLVGDNGFLLAEQGYNRDYPYVASAAIYANGTLNFEMAESKARNGDVILNANQIRDSFSEVAGLVYYFTTGDSTLADQISPKGVVTFNSINVSPTFSIDTENIPSSIGLGNMAIRRKLPYRNDDSPDSTQLGLGIRNTSLVVDTGADEKEILAADYIGTDQIDIVIGTTYIITIIGTTDFTTQFGVVDPVVGTVFLATIAGTISGTGKVQVRYNKGDLVVHGGYVWKALQNVVASAAAPVSGNKWFGYWQTINVSAFRGFALLEGQDPSNFTIKFPAIHDPLVTNIDLSIALFDKLSLSKYFESDGVTPKRETVTTLDGGKSGQRIPLIFTDKKLNLSRMPKDLLLETKWTQTGGTLDDKIFTTPGDSIHLKELSVLSQLDGAGSYKLWFDFEIQPETDFDEDGVYVGSRYAYTVDGENTVFLHRGFKSKNISNIELFNNESFAEDSPYWFKPTATQFAGISSLKIPEFIYLKIYFNEPIDPTKYWINADYNQTAGGDDVYKSVKITNSKQKDINPNIRDYVMEQSNPHPNCYLLEKNERYATFFIAPLWSRPIPYYAQPSHASKTSRLVYTQYVMFQISTYDGAENCSTSSFQSVTGGNAHDVSNWNSLRQGGDRSFTDTWKFTTPEAGTEYEEEVFNSQTDPWYNQDFSVPAEKIFGKFSTTTDNIRVYAWYWLAIRDYNNGQLIASKPGYRLKGLSFAPVTPKLIKKTKNNLPDDYITFYTNQTSPRQYNGGSMHAAGTINVVGNEKSKEYTYNSTPALENYAWELNQEKTATNENKKEKVIHNIKIQGGLLISDEYSAPVLP